MHTDRCGSTCRQKCCAKGRGKEVKIQCIEIQLMWNLKCTIVPVIIWATGIVTRSLKKNLETVPGKHSIDSLQKTTILGTSHIIRKVLECEAWSVSGGDHRWFKRSTGKKCLWQETYISYNNNNLSHLSFIQIWNTGHHKNTTTHNIEHNCKNYWRFKFCCGEGILYQYNWNN